MSGLSPIELAFASFPTLSSEPQRLFLYVTLENYVYETWMRIYCDLTKKTKGEMLAKLRDASVTSKDIQNEIEQILAPYNCSIHVEYFPSNTISPGNIAALIQKYNRNPLHRAVKAVYVDYLDLLQPDEKGEMYRLDLGAITSRLKTISASFEIPIITATQLNREAYRKEKKRTRNLGSKRCRSLFRKYSSLILEQLYSFIFLCRKGWNDMGIVSMPFV